MGTLVQIDSNFVQMLEAETLVGRSPRSQLAITDRLVSTHHASIRWGEDQWLLRDLGSRNGTFVDGRRLTTEEEVRLELGMHIAFGSPQNAYRCVEMNAPSVMLVPLADGSVIHLDNALVAVPSPDHPSATFVLREDGFWTIELGDEARPVSDQEVIEIDGVRYRFCANRGAQRTMAARRSLELPGGARLALELAFTRDEERVELTVIHRDKRTQLGARSCYYALLMLARCRVGEGLPSTMRTDPDGWIGTSTLATMLRTTEQHVNVDIFRIRKALQAATIPDAATLIERKSGLLRLATTRIQLRQI